MSDQSLRPVALSYLPPGIVLTRKTKRRKAIELACIIVTATGSALTLLAASMTPTMGATRSSRLTWEQRSGEIEQSVLTQSQETP